MSSTPECDKMRAISHLSQACGQFIDWLASWKGIHLAEFDGDGDEDTRLYLANASVTGLLAEYFEIDLDKVAAEQAAMLAYLREEQQ